MLRAPFLYSKYPSRLICCILYLEESIRLLGAITFVKHHKNSCPSIALQVQTLLGEVRTMRLLSPKKGEGVHPRRS